jgi:hypothetical protein
MDTIKLYAPAECTAASWGGVEYKVGKDGSVEVPAEAALTLYGFGFGNGPLPKAKAPAVAPEAPKAP